MQFSKHNGFSFGTFFIEVFTIIFSVLLALGVNEYRQHHNKIKMVNTALESIKIELQKNKDFLDLRLPYYISMVDTLDKLIKEHGEDTPFSSISIHGFFGINPPMLRNSSQQTAISTQAFSNIDYSLADKISWVYSFQETYLKWIYIYFDAFFNRESASIKML